MESFFSAIDDRVLIANSVVVLLAVGCLVKGAPPERTAILTIVAMIVIDQINHSLVGYAPSYHSIVFGHLIIDSAALAAFLYLALAANRIYPLCLLGSQLVATVMHLDRLISPYMSPLAYVILNRLPFYIQLITIAVGLTLHIRRVRANGSYPSWRRRSPRFSAAKAR